MKGISRWHHQKDPQTSEKHLKGQTVIYTEPQYTILTAKAQLNNIREQLIKPTNLQLVKRLCGPQVVDRVKTILLSDHTINDRIDKIAAEGQNQLLRGLGMFSLPFSWIEHQYMMSP